MSLTESTDFSWVRNHHSSTLLPRVSKEISVCIPGPHTWGFQLLHQSWVCYRILQHLGPVLEPNQTQTFAFEVINFCSFLPASVFSMNIENGSGFLVKTWSGFAVRQIWDFFQSVCVCECPCTYRCVCMYLKSAGPSSRSREGVTVTQKHESLIFVMPNSEKTLELWSATAHLTDVIINPCWSPLP